MSFFRKPLHWLLLCAAISVAAVGQLPGLPNTTAAPATPPVTDSLGRDTPSGTIYGFLQAAQSGNYAKAAQYLQMTNAKRASQGEQLASQLKHVMDRAFTGNLRLISNKPEGTAQEGSSPDRQHVGELSAGDLEGNLDLVRVTDSGGVKIWLISSDTLAKVPDLYDSLQVHQVEGYLPSFVVRYDFLGMPVWQWLALLLAVPIAAALGKLAIWALGLFRKLYRHPAAPATAWPAISPPLWLVISVTIHIAFEKYLVLPLLLRHYYQRVVGVVFIIAWSWLVWRIVKQVSQRLRIRAIYTGRTGMASLMLLGERILKALIVIVTVFVTLGSLDVNMSTALAGLGIGGIAIAFAAQKTLENLFGGISLLGDEVIRVGDTCRIGDKTGTVEDISLRSTRVRTAERTEVSIPNGLLATVNVENLSRRDKLLFTTKLGLRCETSPDQLRYVLAQTRRLLYEHPKVETDGARIRFIGYDGGSLTLEVFCYVLTLDNGEFLGIQEDLLLRIMDIVAASGSALAFPSRTIYARRDPGLDKEKTEAVSREVEQWRENRALPFPDYAAPDISEFSNSLPYPPPDSALRTRK
jgi:MscS family membrane protein